MEGLKISISENKTIENRGSFLIFLESSLFAFSWIWLLMPRFPFWEKSWPLLFLLSIFFIGLLEIAKAVDKERLLFSVLAFLGLGLIIFNFTAIKNGLFLHINTLLEFLVGFKGRIYLDFPATQGQGLEIFVLSLILFLSLLISRQGIFPLILLFSPLVVAYMMGFIQNGFAWLVFFLGLALRLAGGLEKPQVLFKALGFLSLSVLLVALIGLPLSSEVEKILAKSDLISSNQHESLMPQGQLKNLKPLGKDETPSLEIKADTYEKLYLPKFIGQVYSGNSWEDYDHETRIESENLFYWLHKSGFYSRSSMAGLLEILGGHEAYSMGIKNLGQNSQYQALPQGAKIDSYLDTRQIGGGSEFIREKELNFSRYKGSLPDWYGGLVELVQRQDEKGLVDYLNLEKSYRDFVYENNLQLNNAALGVSRRLLGEESQSKSLVEIQQLILDILEEKLDYKDFVTTRNGNGDFYQFTMEQLRQGYSVHYATAATLMFRYLGVPSRYVEGYYLSADEASLLEDADSVIINENHSHAWAEYYLDGLGWIPFEVTPGYIDEEEIQALAKEIEETQLDGQIGSGNYEQNQLEYKPPKELESEDELDNLDSLFSFSAKLFINLLAILLLLFVAYGLLRIYRRRKKLLDTLAYIRSLPNKEAIEELVAYALMLASKVGLEEPKGLGEIKEINKLARFSNYDMEVEDRNKAESFLDVVKDEARAKLKIWQRIWYKYILWLYA